jgi:hypothetical protein
MTTAGTYASGLGRAVEADETEPSDPVAATRQ